MEIQLDDISIVAEFRRVRNMRLTVYRSGKVMLVLPYLTPMYEAMRFVEQKADWIRKHHKNRFQPSKKEPFHYTDGERHLLFGDSLILQVKQISSGHQTVIKQEDKLVMLCKYDTDESHREALLYSFYRRELNRYLEQRLAYYTLLYKEENVSFHIRRMKTEWGSCIARKRSLLFNLDLALAPPHLIDYVIVHELCHLQVQNHGPKFKTLLGSRMADWQKRKQALNEYAG